MKYRLGTGLIAHYLHRITGIALTFYLCVHIWVIHHLQQGPESFDNIMKTLSAPLFKIAEIGLLAAILYHSFNGLRIVLVDAGMGVKSYKKAFWFAFGLSAFITVLGGTPFLQHIYGGR